MLINKSITLAVAELTLKAATEGALGTFSGYASVFNGVDDSGDTILPGAYADTLKKHGMPKMFFSHSWDLPIGKYPDGSVFEKTKGLYVQDAELTPGITKASDVYAAMKHGSLDGLSIGAIVRKGDYEITEDYTRRTIKKFHRLLEISPVALPADNKARIATVKGEEFADILQEEIEAIETVRQFEAFLRDAGGLSKGAALAMTARAKIVFARRDAVGEQVDTKGFADFASRLKRLESLSAPKA